MQPALGRLLIVLTVWGAGLFLAGCAGPQGMAPRDPWQPISQSDPEWQGRLSVVVHSTPPNAMSAGFLLRGSPDQGALDLYSPLGTTVAAVRWSPGSVLWLHADGEQRFNSLADLTQQATGAAIPVPALFAWLQGSAAAVPGWQADLSGLPQGSLVAKRTAPLPEVVLRLKLD